MKSREHEIQAACIRWFDLTYPEMRLRLFAIPNGGQRSITTAARLKSEGVRAGVWDLFLSVPQSMGRRETPYAGLFIEIKAGKNRLTEPQVKFREALCYDYDFAVCYSVEEFIKAIKGYMSGKT